MPLPNAIRAVVGSLILLPRNPYVDPAWTEIQRIDYVFLSRGLKAKNCSVVFDDSTDSTSCRIISGCSATFNSPVVVRETIEFKLVHGMTDERLYIA